MDILFYRTTSAVNAVTKTLDDALKLTGILRDGEYSITQPVVRVQTNPVGYNYCYVPAFKRYYFVRDVRVARNELFYVSLEVDVLMSFRSEILLLNGLIGKSSEGNPYADGQFDTEARVDISSVPFKNNFSDGEFILITLRAGGT